MIERLGLRMTDTASLEMQETRETQEVQATQEAQQMRQVRRTRPRGSGPDQTGQYRELLGRVRDAGLLDRTRGFYAAVFAGLLAALAADVTGILLVGDSGWQLLLAAALGVITAQLGFLAHEAAHREIFETGKANDAAGLLIGNLLVGISFSDWKTGHNRHHANPNLVGKDPSIDPGVFTFTPDDAAETRGLRAWYTRHQGLFFFAIIPLAGFSLHVQGVLAVFRRGRFERRALEIALLAVHGALYLTLVFSSMSVALGFLFLTVHLLVFGVCTASAFVPNHTGMPVLPRDSRVDFLRRQILTSRNITGGPVATALMGGLNFQIEHHLFPSMPRPHLRKARELVRAYCREHGIGYTETTIGQAYAQIVRYMNEVGLAAGTHSVRCPVAAALGR
jgi:fatty acid desaturase